MHDVPAEKKPTTSRKPPPPRRPRAGEDDDEQVNRRRPPRPGYDDVLTAEALEQMALRGGYSRSELARRIGWNVHSAGRLLNSKGPRQAWTVAELGDVARGLGCSLSSLLVGAGIDPPQVDLIDAAYSHPKLPRRVKETIALLVQNVAPGDAE